MRLHRETSDDGSLSTDDRVARLESMLEASMGLGNQVQLENLSSILKTEYLKLKEEISKIKNSRLQPNSEESKTIRSSVDSLLKQREAQLRTWQLIADLNVLLFELISQSHGRSVRNAEKAFDALSSEITTFLLSILRLFKNYLEISRHCKNQLGLPLGKHRALSHSLKGLCSPLVNECLSSLQNVFRSTWQQDSHEKLRLFNGVINQGRNESQGRLLQEYSEELVESNSSSYKSPPQRLRIQLSAEFLSSMSEDDQVSQDKLQRKIEAKGWKLQKFGKEKAERANEILRETFNDHISRLIATRERALSAHSQQSLWLSFREKFIKLKRASKRRNYQTVIDVRQIAATALETVLSEYMEMQGPTIEKTCGEFAGTLVARLKQLE
jgi:hypothetical protein